MRGVCCLDVHKDSIYMCILYENGSKIESVFGVSTAEVTDTDRDMLRQYRGERLQMEQHKSENKLKCS